MGRNTNCALYIFWKHVPMPHFAQGKYTVHFATLWHHKGMHVFENMMKRMLLYDVISRLARC